jgi:hypothetical protein
MSEPAEKKTEKTVEVKLSATLTVKVAVMGNFVSDASVTELAEEICLKKLNDVNWHVRSEIVGSC